MKLSSLALLASTIALSTTICARPSFLKQIADTTTSLNRFGCLIDLLTTQGVSSTCMETLSRDIKFVKSVQLPNLSFDMRGPNLTISATKIGIELFPLLGFFTVPISQALLNLEILDSDATACTFTSSWSGISLSGFHASLDLAPTAVSVTPEFAPAFSSMLSSLANKNSHTFTLQGKADVRGTITLPGVDTASAIANANPFGNPFANVVAPSKLVTIPGVGVSSEITMVGVNNFGGVVFGQRSTVSTADGGVVRFRVQFKNPSALTVFMDTVAFQASSAGSLIGVLTVQDFNFVPGDTNIFDCILNANAGVDLEKLFPVAAAGLILELNGFSGSSKIPLVLSAVAGAKFNLSF